MFPFTLYFCIIKERTDFEHTIFRSEGCVKTISKMLSQEEYQVIFFGEENY